MDTLSLLRTGRLAGAKRLDLSCGLTEFPREIFDLADSLEVLNLTGNRLSELPDDFDRLHRLRILFCSSNDFSHMPAVLGRCESLSMIGFKSNRIATVDEAAFPPSLRWLILTDNRIRTLPATIGRCSRLQKLMLAGNELETLPQEMASCTSLELIRLAANNLSALPEWLLSLPRLSWLAFSGNPCSSPPENGNAMLREIAWSQIELAEKLGEGASGVIHRAIHREGAGDEDRSVAVKIFKGAVTSDGLPSGEMAACLAAGAHPNLIEMQGRVAQHPENCDGLVMSLIDPAYRNLAAPPDFESCTRDIYADDLRVAPAVLLRIARGVASAAQQLHERGVMHGDLYAHNVLWHEDGSCLLGDFGAASFCQAMDAEVREALERIEVRAFGCLLGELLERVVNELETQFLIDELWRLQTRCCTDQKVARPTFGQINAELRNLSAKVENS